VKYECGMLNAEGGIQRRPASPAPLSARPAFRTQHSAFSPVVGPPASGLQPAPLRRAITLIELLITMVIIAIVSAAILGTAAAAMENARERRTQSLITKISGLVMERWDSYANRRVDVAPNIIQAINALYPDTIDATQRGQMLADARLLALRELMKMEMPDRWSDVLNYPLETYSFPNPPSPTILASTPALTHTYFRHLNEIRLNSDLDLAASNQAAECLYLVVMNATGDGEARTLFTSQDFGDTDGDGAQEFDGWGQPIQWIRWPAGFVSDLQPLDPAGNRDATGDHDPFDIYRRDSPTALRTGLVNISNYPPAMQLPISAICMRNDAAASSTPSLLGAFRLVPLIFSIGADEDSDVIMDSETTTELDPYKYTYGEEGDLMLGQQLDQEENGEGWRDNIYNHLNEY
jgi:prepilin-type N-terminal cleavage/methylation domain-containing protein